MTETGNSGNKFISKLTFSTWIIIALTILSLILLYTLHITYIEKKVANNTLAEIKNYINHKIDNEHLMNSLTKEDTINCITYRIISSKEKHDKYLDQFISQNVIRKLATSSSIIFAIFSSIFILFTFFTGHYLKEAKDTNDAIRRNFDKIQKDVDSKLNTARGLTEKYTSNLEKYKDITLNSPNQVFTILNKFLDKQYQVSSKIIRSVLELWDHDKAHLAIMALRNYEDSSAVIYLKEALAYYQNFPNKEHIVKQIQQTIDSLNNLKKKKK